MIIFLNGRFIPESDAMIPVSDRSFLYGDGLFETVRIHGARLFLWPEHVARLQRGASHLAMALPMEVDALRGAALELIRHNSLRDGSLRLHLSRGSGPRGYSPCGADQPRLIMTVHPGTPLEVQPPAEWHLITSSQRLPAGDPLANLKTACKLPQICAKAEADRLGADDALLLNTRGEAVESSCASLSWFVAGGIAFPGPDSGAVSGTTHAYIRRLVHRLGWSSEWGVATPDGLRRASGVFLSFSGKGIVAVTQLDGQPVPQDPRLRTLATAFMDSLSGELSD